MNSTIILNISQINFCGIGEQDEIIIDNNNNNNNDNNNYLDGQN